MAPVKDKRGPADSAPEDPGPQRPKTLFKRLSSGLSTILPNISSRRRSLTTRSSDRPMTAPSPSHKHKHRSNRTQRHLPNEEFMVIPQINIPRLSDADSICSYDASTYHSFPSIEDERCSFCGMRSLPRKISASLASNRPCDHYRSHSPFSHLGSPFRHPKRQESSSRATSSDLPVLDEISPLIEEIPRIVPYEIAARRIGNPPRRSSLPAGLRPSYGTSHLSPAHASIPHTHHDHHSRATLRHSSSASGDSRPISPRLHHIHGLPHAHSHPYVRESEIDAHIAALEAGSPSPLLQVVNEGSSVPEPSQSYRDFSRTVFYGTTPASAASSLVIRRVETSARIVVDEAEVSRARVRLRVEETEIRRAGGGHTTSERTQQRSQSAHHEGPSETLPPPPTRPIADPVAEESRKIENGGSNLQLRGGDVSCTLSQECSSLRTSFSPRIYGSVPPCQQYPHHRWSLTSTPPPSYAPQDPQSPILRLRGGASSPPRLPPTLYFLAGGTGRRPISIRTWKQQRGTRRMGEFLRIAVYGMRARKAWNDDEDKEDNGSQSHGEGERGDRDEEKMVATSSTTATQSASRGRGMRSMHTNAAGSSGSSASSAATSSGDEAQEEPAGSATGFTDETRANGEHEGNEDSNALQDDEVTTDRV